jgi:hypothetical protein
VLIAVRSAARIDSRLGTPGVTATPVITFVAQSMNHVTHGLTSRPSTSTSTDASTWSLSHAWLRCPGGR